MQPWIAGSHPLRPLSPEALVASEIRPRIAARAGQTIKLRRLPDENIADLKASGLTRVLQSQRSGGSESSLHTHLDVVSAIAEGCGSTAWCLGVYHAHQWLVGQYDPQAQDDVYKGNPDALIAAMLAPRGTTRSVAGGIELSGTWFFCSGVHHAEWMILGAMVEDATTGKPDPSLLLVPRSNVTVNDDWYVAGLAGTGSNSVSVKGAVVPPHRVLSMSVANEGKRPGANLHSSTLYHSALIPTLALFISSPVIGMARHALAAFAGRLPGRTVSQTLGEKQREMAVTHLQIGEAATKIDAAHLILRSMIDEIEHYADRRETMPVARRAKARMDCAYAVRTCLEAADSLLLASGGSGLATGNEVQIAAQDIRAANLHATLHFETATEMYGRVLLGLPAGTPIV